MDTYRNPDTCLYGNVIPCGSVCPGTVLGAVVIAVPMLVLTVLLKGGFGGGDIKLMAVSGFLNGVKVITYAGMLGNHIERHICKHDAGSRKDGTKGQFCSWSLSCYGNYWNEIMDLIS